jgi:hypothetical protein
VDVCSGHSCRDADWCIGVSAIFVVKLSKWAAVTGLMGVSNILTLGARVIKRLSSRASIADQSLADAQHLSLIISRKYKRRSQLNGTMSSEFALTCPM